MIEVAQLTKRYGSVEAVRGISFTVKQGSVVGFLGPNGAGKSTTLRILAGFIGATAGSVRIGGHDIVDERFAALEQIGYMPETSPLYPEMRVREYLAFRAELKGVARKERAREVERVARRAKVADMVEVIIGNLSKGYRQRVGLADALIGSPPVLILDEPTAGLDPNQIRDVRALIRGLGEQHTVLLSTHILPEVEAICDQVVVIHRGELVATGPLEELRGEAERGRVDVVLSAALERVREVLDGHEGVAELSAAVGAEAGTHELALRFDIEPGDDDLGERIEALVYALTGARVGVRAVKTRGGSLEELFAQLTQASAEPAVAGAAGEGAS
jgi:ABC-2 type transport system ATP-binding protein